MNFNVGSRCCVAHYSIHGTARTMMVVGKWGASLIFESWNLSSVIWMAMMKVLIEICAESFWVLGLGNSTHHFLKSDYTELCWKRTLHEGWI